MQHTIYIANFFISKFYLLFGITLICFLDIFFLNNFSFALISKKQNKVFELFKSLSKLVKDFVSKKLLATKIWIKKLDGIFDLLVSDKTAYLIE